MLQLLKPTHSGAPVPQIESPHAAATEPTSSGACVPQLGSPGATTTETHMLWRLCATTREPCTTTKDMHDATKVLPAATKTWCSQKNLLANKSPRPDCFTDKFYQTFREELTPMFLKLIQKIAEKGRLLSLLYEATITLILIPQKTKIIDQYHWRTHTPKFSTKYEQTEFNNTLRDHIPWLSGTYPRYNPLQYSCLENTIDGGTW